MVLVKKEFLEKDLPSKTENGQHFESMYSELYEIQKGRHLRNKLRFKTGRHSRRAVHAPRLLPFQKSLRAEVGNPAIFNTIPAVREPRLFHSFTSSIAHGVCISTELRKLQRTEKSAKL